MHSVPHVGPHHPLITSSSSSAVAPATTTPTKRSSCAAHARSNLRTVARDMLHRPRHRVRLDGRRSDADMKGKMLEKPSRTLNDVPHHKS